MEANAAIMARMSIRQYKPDPIDEKVLAQVLEAARRAPSWANTQCWRLVVVQDKAIKNKLADTMFSFPGRTNQTAEAIRVAPVAIAVCAEIGKSGFSFREPKEAATDKGDSWYMFDAALATENLCLAACALGLGTVIIGAFSAIDAGKLLGVPEGFVVVCLTPLGYPDEAPDARPRKEMKEIVSYDRFAF